MTRGFMPMAESRRPATASGIDPVRLLIARRCEKVKRRRSSTLPVEAGRR
jgi:hypothetical protein